MTDKLSGYSTTPGSNNGAVPDGWPEGMLPSDVNNCAREMMARMREWYDDAAWVNLGHTVVSATSNSIVVSGDQTAFYVANRALRADGTDYGYVSASNYSAPNTSVTVQGFSVSGTPTTVELGIIYASNQLPRTVPIVDLSVTGTLTVSGSASFTGTTTLGTNTTGITAAGSDSSTKLATTAQVKASITDSFSNGSVTTAGFQVLPGGLTIQWGTTPTITTGGSYAVTFPYSFTTAVYSATATRNQASFAAQRADAIYSISATGMTIDNGSGDAVSIFSWMALGK